MPRYERLRDTSAREAARYIRELEQRIGRLESKREQEGVVTQVLGATQETVGASDSATVAENDPAAGVWDSETVGWGFGEFR